MCVCVEDVAWSFNFQSNQLVVSHTGPNGLLSIKLMGAPSSLQWTHPAEQQKKPFDSSLVAPKLPKGIQPRGQKFVVKYIKEDGSNGWKTLSTLDAAVAYKEKKKKTPAERDSWEPVEAEDERDSEELVEAEDERAAGEPVEAEAVEAEDEPA